MFLFNAEITAILNAGEYIRVVIEETVFKEKKFGWGRWLFKNPEKVEAYEHFRIASLSILGFLYTLCVLGAICYCLGDIVSIGFIVFFYGLMGIIAFVKCAVPLRTSYLFTVMDGGLEKDLNNNSISERLKKKFKDKNIPLSKNITITKENRNKWQITDKEKNNTFIVIKKEEKLKIYKVSKG